MVGVRSPSSGSDGIFYGDEEFVKNTINSGNSCAYDANGNRLYDSDSNIWGINYNLLNLPDAMQFYQGHQTIYTYSATGAKLKVVDKTAPEGVILPVTSLNTVLSNPSVSTITTTDYVGNVIYENGTLKRILTPEGYWQDGTYYYFLKDHLGSNRVVINSSGGIAETSSYYPSGMRFGESAAKLNNSVQPYRHTGHEMQSMHGLNWIDNGARFRTVDDGGGLPTVDPLAEKYYSISPYAYCAGNPVNRIDPDGMDWVITTEQKDGKTIYHITVNASLYNNSSTNYSQKQINQLADKIKSESMSAFNTSGKGYSVDFKMNLNVAKSVDNIKSTDHVYQIVDQNVVGTGVNGNSDTNGLNIKLGTTVVDDILDGKNNRTAAHELGHTGGLDDANLNVKQSSQFGVTLNNNLMSQSKYIQDHGGDAINANNLTQGQINYIYNNRNNLNQNSPVTREMTPTNVPMQSYLLLNLHLVPVTTLRK